MMVFKMLFLSNMAILGIYVRFQGCNMLKNWFLLENQHFEPENTPQKHQPKPTIFGFHLFVFGDVDGFLFETTKERMWFGVFLDEFLSWCFFAIKGCEWLENLVAFLRWAMKKNGWLGYIGDYTTQVYRDYNNKPL